MTLSTKVHITQGNNKMPLSKRVHKALGVRPAMASGVAARLWSVEDIAELVDAAAPKPGPRRPYKKNPA